MANFQKSGKNVNGGVIPAPRGSVFEVGVWGPIDVRDKRELTVSVSPPSPVVKLVRAGMVPGQNVRVWQVSGLPDGLTKLVATDGGGTVWTTVTCRWGKPPTAMRPETLYRQSERGRDQDDDAVDPGGLPDAAS